MNMIEGLQGQAQGSASVDHTILEGLMAELENSTDTLFRQVSDLRGKLGPILGPEPPAPKLDADPCPSRGGSKVALRLQSMSHRMSELIAQVIDLHARAEV